MEAIQGQLVELFATILVAMISLLGAYAILYVNKARAKVQLEIEKISDEQSKGLLNQSLDMLDNITKTNVVFGTEVLVKAIKEASADGKVTKEEYAQVKADVMDKIKNQLSDSTAVYLSTQIDDVDDYISSLIEKQLAEIKGQIEK